MVLTVNLNEACTNDDICVRTFSEKFECVDGTCSRRFLEFTNLEIIGLIFVTLVVTITNSGGVGAGVAIAPCMEVCFAYPIALAIPQARVPIFIGCLTSFFVTGLSRSRNNPNKFQTDYALAATVSPLQLAGAQAGVILSFLVPPLFMSCFLITYIIISLVQTYKKAIRESNKEKVTVNSTAKEIPSNPFINTNPREMESLENQNTGNEFKLISEEDEGQKPERKTKCQLISEQLPNFMIILLSIGCIVLSSLLRGGRSIKSIIGIDECSGSSWFVLICGQAICIAIAYFSYQYNNSTFQEMDRESMIKAKKENDKEFRQARVNLIITCYLAGFIAGFIGVTGGMVMSFFMVGLDMDVFSITALTNFMALVSSASTTFQYAALGAIQFKNSMVFVVVALIGSAFGNLIFKTIFKLQKPSLIFWILFSFLWLALVILSYEAIDNLRIKGYQSLEFGTFC